MALLIRNVDNMELSTTVPTTLAPRGRAWNARISTSQAVYVSTTGDATEDDFVILEYGDELIAVGAEESLSLLGSEPATLVSVAEVDVAA